MATAQEYYVFLPLRGGHLSCHFLRKAPLKCQSYFKDQNKNNQLQRENVLAHPLGSGILWYILEF